MPFQYSCLDQIVSALMYIVCNLHKVAKETLGMFQDKYNLTHTDMLDFKNAFNLLKQKTMKITQAEENHESEKEIDMLKVEFYNQLQCMKKLFKGKNENITEFEIAEVEYQYHLLSVPKTSGEIATDVKKNISRMKVFVDACGGIDYNVGITKRVAAESPDAFLYFVDDEFQAYDIFGFQEELTWAITVSPQKNGFLLYFVGL